MDGDCTGGQTCDVATHACTHARCGEGGRPGEGAEAGDGPGRGRWRGQKAGRGRRRERRRRRERGRGVGRESGDAGAMRRGSGREAPTQARAARAPAPTRAADASRRREHDATTRADRTPAPDGERRSGASRRPAGDARRTRPEGGGLAMLRVAAAGSFRASNLARPARDCWRCVVAAAFSRATRPWRQGGRAMPNEEGALAVGGDGVCGLSRASVARRAGAGARLCARHVRSLRAGERLVLGRVARSPRQCAPGDRRRDGRRLPAARRLRAGRKRRRERRPKPDLRERRARRLVLWDRLRVGFNLPVAVFQDGHDGVIDGVTYAPPSTPSVGDLRLGADLRLVGTYGDPFTLALGARVYVPTGQRDNYTGDGAVRIDGRLEAAGDLGLFTYAARVGARVPQPRGHDRRAARSARRCSSEPPRASAPSNHALRHRARGLRGHRSSPRATPSSRRSRRRSTPSSARTTRSLRDFRLGGGRRPRPHARTRFARGALAGVARVGAGVRRAAPSAGAPGRRDARAGRIATDDGRPIDDTTTRAPTCAGVKTDDPKTNGCPPDRDGTACVDDGRRVPRRAGRQDRRPEDQRLPAGPGRRRHPRQRRRVPRRPGHQDRRPEDQRMPRSGSGQGRHPEREGRLPRRGRHRRTPIRRRTAARRRTSRPARSRSATR